MLQARSSNATSFPIFESEAGASATARNPLLPATARGQATRQRLLQAAEQEFSEKGFHAASVSSVTTRAGVGQGTFYLYFRTKEEVFVTLVRDIGTALRACMRAAVVGEPNAALAASVEAFVRFIDEHPGQYRIVQESQFVDALAHREFFGQLVAHYADSMPSGAGADTGPDGVAAPAWVVLGVGHALVLQDGLDEAASDASERARIARAAVARLCPSRR